jgi:CRISPR/Cas system CSM-associated protein Csm3 (group 7 of RAMP superfamily)
MHAHFYNEATLTLRLRPRTPLLIKSGRSGEDALDPTLPEMSFVRTQRPGQSEPEVYIPGASLRGVLRSHAEKLLRSVATARVCDPTQTGAGGTNRACFAGESNTEKIDGPDAYVRSCYACKVFGNTTLAGRARIGDMYILDPERKPLLDRRYGVAIDRVTGAVAQGPFEIEIMTDGWLEGRVTIRNYTVGQFGLLAGALLDLSDGLIPLGYGKSRGLGRVELRIADLAIRTLRPPEGALVGVGALADSTAREKFALPADDRERLELAGARASQARGFFTLQPAVSAEDDAPARAWLERAAERWVAEVAP